MGHDVFISYAAEDKLVADAVCAALEAGGTRCWIAPRDILAGQDYGAAIVAALGQVQVLVLVFSGHANASEHVLNEIERAVSRGLPVVPLRTEAVAPTGSLELHLSRRHWLDALTPPLEQHIQRLREAVNALLGAHGGPREGAADSTPMATTAGGPTTPSALVAPRKLRSRHLHLVAAGLVVLALAFAAGWLGRGHGRAGISALLAPDPEANAAARVATPSEEPSEAAMMGYGSAPRYTVVTKGRMGRSDGTCTVLLPVTGKGWSWPGLIPFRGGRRFKGAYLFEVERIDFLWGKDAAKLKGVPFAPALVQTHGYVSVTWSSGERDGGWLEAPPEVTDFLRPDGQTWRVRTKDIKAIMYAPEEG